MYQQQTQSPWFPFVPCLDNRVGGPGDGWMQAPTEQEKKLGYKKTDVMTLQIKCADLRKAIDDVLANVDAAATDPGSLQALQKLQKDVAALESAVNDLAKGLRWDYPILLMKFNAYAADWAGYGIEQVEPPKPSGGGSPPVVVPPTVVKPPATAASPVIAKKAPSDPDWLLGASGALAVIGIAIGTKLAGLW